MTGEGARKRLTGARLAGLLAAAALFGGLAVAGWWYRPANRVYRYNRMSRVELRQLLDRDSGNGEAWRVMALRLAHDGDMEMAEPAFRQAIALNPRDSQLSAGLGELLTAKGAYAEATKVLTQLVSSDPSSQAAHRALGSLYLRLGFYASARAQFQVLTKLNAGDDDAWCEIAVCSISLRDLPAASSAIERALSIQPNNAAFVAVKGEVDEAEGLFDAAGTEARRAAQLAPNDVNLAAALVDRLLSHARGPADTEAAEHAIDQLERLAPGFPLLTLQRGRLELLKGDWSGAERYLRMAWRSNESKEAICLPLSQADRILHKTQEAGELQKLYQHYRQLRAQLNGLESAAADHPEIVTTYIKMADLEMQLGEQAAALNSVNAGLSIDPQNAMLMQARKMLGEGGMAHDSLR